MSDTVQTQKVAPGWVEIGDLSSMVLTMAEKKSYEIGSEAVRGIMEGVPDEVNISISKKECFSETCVGPEG